MKNLLIVAIGVSLVAMLGCSDERILGPAPPDEAKANNKRAGDFPTARHDFFKGMDMEMPDDKTHLVDVDLKDDEIKGRNTWNMWCGGNERFWDWLGFQSFGFFDLLKLVASPDAETAKAKRKMRFKDVGVVNEPDCTVPMEPDEYGLFIDQPDPKAPRAREEIYGRSSGVMGLRIFKNPLFDKNAQKRWDAARYFKDADYFGARETVRPYRVGMSCGFCHIGPHPLNPPKDINEPQWANLSSIIGAQYWHTRAIVGNQLTPDNFVYHVLDAQPPGTIDTSLVASDNINNPNAMNAIFEVPARLDRAGINVPPFFPMDPKRSVNRSEKLTPAQIGYMPSTFKGDPDSSKESRPVPRILFEGADSVGTWGALARVYLNIGTYSEQWERLHNTLLGYRMQKPFKLEDCEKNSVYWEVNKERVEYVAKFFLKATKPMRLKDAVGGAAYFGPDKKDKTDVTPSKSEDINVPWGAGLAGGRTVFARRCIVCHSSKQPQDIWTARAAEFDKGDALLDIMASEDYQKWAQEAVKEKNFWEKNYLSTDHRVSVKLLGTNIGRSLATNGIRGQMWEDFTSITYKSLPSVGKVKVFDPYAKKDVDFDMPGRDPATQPDEEKDMGGRGYYRPSSLVSIWATAPYLHNNTVGIFNGDPSVEGRMKAFDDGIKKLLVNVSADERKGKTFEQIQALAAQNRWKLGSDLNGATKERLAADHGLIWRTPEETYIRIKGRFLPDALKGMTSINLPFLFDYPWALPLAVLAIALLFLLLATWTKIWWRWLGYAFILLTILLAFVNYFLAGRLGDLEIGPIPKGTPVNLLANIDPDPANRSKVQAALLDTVWELQRGKRRKLTGEELREALQKEIAPKLLSLSKCPDLVMDRGHYFAMELDDQELKDLIRLIKTF